MILTEENVLLSLKKVDDPDFKKDLVTLNMIKNIVIGNNQLQFTIELTTPACPLKEKLETDCRNVILEDFGSETEIEIAFTSRVTTPRAKMDILPGVKNVIAVASGKGGVGKSTVSVNLALGLAKSGATVGIIDADIYGPSIPMMLGLRGMKPGIKEVDGKHKIIPIEIENTKVLSIGFLIEENQAIVWRGPMVASALKQFVTDVIWGELDYLIVDLPPGTGDIHLSLIQNLPVTGAIIVSTPQEVAIADAKKAISMFQMDSIALPIIGIVENMAYFIPPDMPEKKYFIFGEGGAKKMSEDYKIPFLGYLPLISNIRKDGDNGTPSILNENSNECDSFEELVNNVARNIAILNQSKIKSHEEFINT